MPKRALVIAGVAVLALVAGYLVLSLSIAASVTAPTGVTLTGWATDTEPLAGGVGTIRNDGPFEVEVTAVRSVGADATISLTAEGDKPGQPFDEGDRYSLAAGSEAFVWFSLTTVDGEPAGFNKIEVDYVGPLGIGHTATGVAIGMLAYPQALPAGVASLDDSAEALGEYLQAIRDAVAAGDTEWMALVLGKTASENDAAAFISAHAGLTDSMGYTAEETNGGTTIAFFESDSAVDSLPAFTVAWASYRWHVVE